MFHRKQINLRKLAVVVLLGTAVAACSGGGGGDDGNEEEIPPPPPVVSNPLNVFGAAFATAFNASADSEPVSVGEDDIIPISLTDEPVEIIWN